MTSRYQPIASLYSCSAAADVIIKEQLQSLKHKEFETARLQCKVKNPKKLPVKWFKDGKEISPSDDSRYSPCDSRNDRCPRHGDSEARGIEMCLRLY